MFQRGRPEQPIKYKAEVLKIEPNARLYKNVIGCAIIVREKRVSDVYRAPWKCWESAYYYLTNQEPIIEPKL